MDFSFTAEQEAFRTEVQRFIDETLTEAFWADHQASGGGGSSPAFSRQAAETGWLAVAWPEEYGGGGRSFIEQMIYMEVMAYAGAPQEHHRRAVQQVGPSIILSGNDEQKADLLPKIAAGEISFAMGLSEPTAGSDLASVTTAARRDGDEWVVNGQKRFTSGAHFSDFLWTMVRTDPDAPKHRGISMLSIPLDADGVRVEPLIDMQDRHGFNQVFLEDVRVPASNLVGEENRGWYVNAATMDFERSGISRFAFLRQILDRLLADVRAIGGADVQPIGHTARRARAAELATRTEVGKLLAHRIISLQSSGALPNYEVSIGKLTVTETIQQSVNLAVAARGLAGLLGYGGDNAEEGTMLEWGPLYLDAVRHTIGQGAAEIQRNIVATRGLGLPRG